MTVWQTLSRLKWRLVASEDVHLDYGSEISNSSELHAGFDELADAVAKLGNFGLGSGSIFPVTACDAVGVISFGVGKKSFEGFEFSHERKGGAG